jgi:hypothetical protein
MLQDAGTRNQWLRGPRTAKEADTCFSGRCVALRWPTNWEDWEDWEAFPKGGG